jgi:hypothetical protein
MKRILWVFILVTIFSCGKNSSNEIPQLKHNSDELYSVTLDHGSNYSYIKFNWNGHDYTKHGQGTLYIGEFGSGVYSWSILGSNDSTRDFVKLADGTIPLKYDLTCVVYYDTDRKAEMFYFSPYYK